MSIWEQPFESKSETSHTFTTKYLIVLFPKNKGIFSITTIYSYQKQKIITLIQYCHLQCIFRFHRGHSNVLSEVFIVEMNHLLTQSWSNPSPPPPPKH